MSDQQIQETRHQYILQVFMSGVSILCCLIITIGFVAFKNLRKSALKLVLFLCISEMIFSMSMMMRSPNQQNNQLCAAQNFFGNLGHLLSIFWTCMISYSLHRSICYGYEYVKCIMNKIILTSLFVPTSLAGLILLRQYFFTENNFCKVLQEGIEGTTLNSDEFSFYIQKLIILLEFQIPIYISFGFNLRQIICVAKIAKENQVHNVSLKLRRIYVYPFIIPICQFFALIYQIYVLCGGNPDNQVLITLNIIFSSSQGAVNSIVYGFNQKLRWSFKNAYNNRMSAASTNLNESLVNNGYSSSQTESPERRKSGVNNIVKAYQTASEDEEEDRVQGNSFKKLNMSKSNSQNNISKSSNLNSTKCGSNNNLNTIPEQPHESSYERRSSKFKSFQHNSSTLIENHSFNEGGEVSDDLLDDFISNHSTPSKQFQLTIADF
ncbi:hypothetical protein ABPG72_004784 [Tetrahymena utriculariae]